MEEHPVRLVVEDDLHRNRWTVFFRLILVIPHVIWIFLWTIAVFFKSPLTSVYSIASQSPSTTSKPRASE